MAGGYAVNGLILFCTLLSLFGPSTSYLDYNLENSRVCSISRKRELRLQEKENSAISLKELRYFDKWSGIYPFNCNFTVSAPNGYGIIAVIQNLDLRKNESTQECIDYVQFQKRNSKIKAFIFGSDLVRSQKFCGIVNSIHEPDEADELKVDIVAQNAFIDDKGNLDVTISVASQQLLSSEKLDIFIIFTAYKPCKYGDGYKQCSATSSICIWEGFFDDTNVNCPYNNCFDEGGCPVMSPGGKRQRSGLGTTVTIGAVVIILGLLVLFMFCLFVCRRCKVLCWSGSSSRQQRASQQPGRVEMSTPMGNVGVSGAQNQPTAPPLLPVTSTASPVHEDKDLPPPYESLFPSR
ncbi:putative leucine-rich repeat receptor-like protein kinase IMK2 [Frankliniella fusca]|uniref:Leucine-rich repeat receptor-like protein kinase IMK2 n=1 Tax=Frankliniella fusca TaxID=407009 RepID=A0AAE1GXE5_9NEOP|nr:putative leucine-rich repeat receptor-like protein kinase IMK2 [Frankliniella fusca]